MTEAEYWVCLEYRLCREFVGMPAKHLRRLWCDGLLPTQYLLDDSIPRITGLAWIWNGPSSEEWTFTLYLPQAVVSKEAIDWSSLLPAGNVTCWIALDEAGKRIQIEPSAAVPDLA